MVETINYDKLFDGIYKDKTVLITGHTGFKGSWLVLWLHKLGAKVIGYSLEPPTTPNHFNLLDIEIESIIANILDKDKLLKTCLEYQPDIIFHLAAQPLVRDSYKEPKETFEVNVMGVVNLFEVARESKSIKAIINVTSDKCYENREWVWGYRENEPMGGYDPYSASKGCSEIVTSAYKNSFFNLSDYGIKHNTLIASARAGNVIGGGDWAKDRLIPDIIRAVDKNEVTLIRSPSATRPWQHTLEALSGYLHLGTKLLDGKKEFAEAWNFGPSNEEMVSVKYILSKLKQGWDKVEYKIAGGSESLHEANLLKLDSSKANSLLKWKSVWDLDTNLNKTINWYKSFYEKNVINSEDDLNSYIAEAKNKNLEWAN